MSTSPAVPLRARLRPSLFLAYPEFERVREMSERLGLAARALTFGETDCGAWYRRFADDVVSATEEGRYLPVYRMGDGEFSFALGAYEEFAPVGTLGARQLARRVLTRLAGRAGGHRSGSPGYGWEIYSPRERRALLEVYAADLREIARRGYLALALDESPLYARYLPQILDWFDAREVSLGPKSHQHVYAVYVLLHGPDRRRLLEERRVLVVNHADRARRDAVEGALVAAGVREVRWIGISRDRAMLEEIDPAPHVGKVDLALVGAGVGASRIVRLLEPLAVPALDVGFALDVLADPELRWTRPYCVPDGEMELARVRFLPAELHRRLLAGAGTDRHDLD